MARDPSLYPVPSRNVDSPDAAFAINDLDTRAVSMEAIIDPHFFPEVGDFRILAPEGNLILGEDDGTSETSIPGGATIGGATVGAAVAYVGGTEIQLLANNGQILLTGVLRFVDSDLPSSDPGVLGQIWSDPASGHAVKVSQG